MHHLNPHRIRALTHLVATTSKAISHSSWGTHRVGASLKLAQAKIAIAAIPIILQLHEIKVRRWDHPTAQSDQFNADSNRWKEWYDLNTAGAKINFGP